LGGSFDHRIAFRGGPDLFRSLGVNIQNDFFSSGDAVDDFAFERAVTVFVDSCVFQKFVVLQLA
jgi:hypothetical protein